MRGSTLDQLKTRISHHRPVMAFAIGLLLAVLFGVLSFQSGVTSKTEEYQSYSEVTESEVAMPRSAPVTLRIPKLNLVTTFEEPLGVTNTGAVEVPDSYEKVGWYKHGPTPGELGPAVILGHVDSYLGPAVFYRLGRLAPGDEILVDREDGTTAVFEVVDSERLSQSTFPTEKVYGDIDHVGLRIITCSGVYNRGTLRYSHNLIVYAKLKESTE